jgi:hypothetical protein
VLLFALQRLPALPNNLLDPNPRLFPHDHNLMKYLATDIIVSPGPAEAAEQGQVHCCTQITTGRVHVSSPVARWVGYVILELFRAGGDDFRREGIQEPGHSLLDTPQPERRSARGTI